MVAHQAVGEHLRVETVHRVGNGVQVREAIVIVAIDRLAPVTAGRDVIGNTQDLTPMCCTNVLRSVAASRSSSSNQRRRSLGRVGGKGPGSELCAAKQMHVPRE